MNPDSQNTDAADDDLEIDLPKGKKFVYPDGEYEFVVVEVERDISSNGNPTLIWNMRGPDELNNALFKTWTAITPDALWKLTEYAEALGLAKEGEKIKISELRTKSIGRKLIGKLKQETVKGTLRSNVKEVKRHPDGPGETRALASEAPPF